jgi:hypothetical protein
MNKLIFKLSNRKNKKYKVFNTKLQKWIHFGDKRYEHYHTSKYIPKNLHIFKEHNDEQRKKNYQKRASNIRDKNGDYTYLDENSPNFYSYWFLWELE